MKLIFCACAANGDRHQWDYHAGWSATYVPSDRKLKKQQAGSYPDLEENHIQDKPEQFLDCKVLL